MSKRRVLLAPLVLWPALCGMQRGTWPTWLSRGTWLEEGYFQHRPPTNHPAPLSQSAQPRHSSAVAHCTPYSIATTPGNYAEPRTHKPVSCHPFTSPSSSRSEDRPWSVVQRVRALYATAGQAQEVPSASLRHARTHMRPSASLSPQMLFISPFPKRLPITTLRMRARECEGEHHNLPPYKACSAMCSSPAICFRPLILISPRVALRVKDGRVLRYAILLQTRARAHVKGDRSRVGVQVGRG